MQIICMMELINLNPQNNSQVACTSYATKSCKTNNQNLLFEFTTIRNSNRLPTNSLHPSHPYIGIPLSVPYISKAFSTFIPFFTSPNTTWCPSSHGQGTVVIKNCDPFVFGPQFAMESNPGPVCFSVKFSSAKRSP